MVESTISMTMKRIHRPEDKQVSQIIAAARRDPQKFGELYALYAQPVYRYLYSRIGSVPEAEDVTAQTFLAALEHFPKYQHDGYFASWLFSIARNKTMDFFRQRRNETSLDETEIVAEDSNLLQQIIKTERIIALSKLIRSLSFDEQELIRLRYVADLRFAEIGHLLNQKEDTVKKTLYRLLARLKAQTDTEYPMENSHV
ncbi:MAG: RNA polymerase subunit sigma-24 [Anaerolineales bacterium]|nr:sigma-70 family RNA polymerase sigma factor [Anaerolineae bacterium]PWB50505.1 MAG: RNA polymerase subunit sigma-24 [Anaerolineales bacterium]